MGTEAAQKSTEPYWLVYIALVLSGIILLGHTFHVAELTRWTSKVGIAMIYSAFALFMAKGTTPGWLSALLVSGTAFTLLILH